MLRWSRLRVRTTDSVFQTEYHPVRAACRVLALSANFNAQESLGQALLGGLEHDPHPARVSFALDNMSLQGLGLDSSAALHLPMVPERVNCEALRSEALSPGARFSTFCYSIGTAALSPDGGQCGLHSELLCGGLVGRAASPGGQMKTEAFSVLV